MPQAKESIPKLDPSKGPYPIAPSDPEKLAKKKRKLLNPKQSEALGQFYRQGRKDTTSAAASESDPLDWILGPETTMPAVSPPSMFQADVPMNITDPKLARTITEMMNLDPYTKSRISRVQYGPTGSQMRSLMRAGMDPDDLESNWLGTYNFGSREIMLQPELKDIPGAKPPDVVASHEIAHAAGYPHRKDTPANIGAEDAAVLYEMYGENQPIAPLSNPLQKLMDELEKAGIPRSQMKIEK